MNTRRQFLITAPMGARRRRRVPREPPEAPAAVLAPTRRRAADVRHRPGAGPPVSPATFAEAEKLAQVTMTAAEREMAAGSWRRSMAPLLERRTGPRKVALDAERRAGDAVEPARSIGATHGPDARPVRAQRAPTIARCRRATPTSPSRR